MRFLRFSCAVLAAAVALPALTEDLTVVSKFTGPRNTGGTSTQYFSSSKFRSAQGDSETIFDVTASTITVIDNRKKEYWSSTLAEMNAMMSAASDQMKQMQEKMKDNPAAAQMMEKMMGGGGAAAASVQKGPNPKKIAGYDCDHWVASMGESMKMEMWTTSAITPPTQFWEARQAQMSANPMTQRYAKLFEEMKKIKGFTLAETTSISMMGRNMGSSSEATEVKKGPIPESAFAIPAGYKKVESPMKDAAAKMKTRG